MRCPVQYLNTEINSFEGLQTITKTLLQNKKVFNFCIYEVATDDGNSVLHPDILDPEPLLGTDTQIVINIPSVTSEPYVSTSIQDPTWKDVLNIINDMLICIGYDEHSNLSLQSLEIIGITQSGFGHFVQAVISDPNNL